MCGRFTLRTPRAVLAKQFAFELDASLAGISPRYKIAPTQAVFAVRQIEQAAGIPAVSYRPLLDAVEWTSAIAQDFRIPAGAR
jgi:putative SOS response-associated peptidase YedK